MAISDYQPCVTAIATTCNANRDAHIIAGPAHLEAYLPRELLDRGQTYGCSQSNAYNAVELRSATTNG
jgi:hypothetical protein